VYAHADGEHETMRYDRVIRCTGFRFDASLFSAECAPQLTIKDRFPAMTSMWESVNVSGLFFAGTLMQAVDHRHAASAFIHGYRYNIRTLSGYLGRRYHGDTAVPTSLPAAAGPLADWVLRRVSTTTALWAQFELLCDLVTVGGSGVRVYQELPLGSVPGEFAPPHGHYFTICFEWGTWDGDVFAIHRHPRSEMAHTNVFLHPVVRCYRDGSLVAEHHVLEDLMGNYRVGGENGTVIERGGRPVDDYHDRQHRAPLVRFFDAHLAEAGR